MDFNEICKCYMIIYENLTNDVLKRVVIFGVFVIPLRL